VTVPIFPRRLVVEVTERQVLTEIRRAALAPFSLFLIFLYRDISFLAGTFC
jgi:hypothetical protein